MNLPGRSFWVAQLAGWGGYSLIMWLAILPTSQGGLSSILEFVPYKIALGVAGFVTSTALGLLYARLLERMPSVTLLTGLAAGASVAGSLVFGILIRILLGTRPLLSKEILKGASYWAITLLAWSALYLTFTYRRQLEAETQRALRADALASAARLQMLRYQVNPHFLFNALNSIRALIDEDPARARAMVTELAEFFRYSVLTGRTDDAPLSAEVDAIRSYLAIQKIRFEEKLLVTIEVSDEAGETRIPGFLVHPLVENAVKYGMETSPMPLRLEIRASKSESRLRVAVSNTGRWKAADQATENGTGTGLSNVRERLAQLYPGRHRLDVREADGWVRAILEVEGRS